LIGWTDGVTERRDLADQIAFYEANAGDYGRAFDRVGPWDYGEDANAHWRAEWRAVRAVVGAELQRPVPRGAAIDVACGTGWWTRALLDAGFDVTAVDSSPSMLKLAVEELGEQASRVHWVEADVFQYAWPNRISMVFLGLWLSHVPRDLVGCFLSGFAERMARKSRVLVVDHLERADTFAKTARQDEALDMSMRMARDGKEYVIPKVFRGVEEIAELFRAVGMKHRRVYQGDFFFVDCAERL